MLPQTTLVVGPTHWRRADFLPNFRPLSDSNVVYAIHFHDPMVFTHQGHWNSEEPLSSIRGLPFPIQSGSPVVRNLRQRLLEAGKQRALQELDGAIDQAGKRDIISTQLEPAVAWQRQAQGFGLLDENTGRPDAAIMHALLGRP